MKNVKSILVGTGSFVLAGLILNLFGPKVAHAVTAAAVIVMNTSANPVPSLDAEKNARIPYQSTGTVLCTTACVGGTTPVPTGYRLVAQSVSFTATSLTSAFASAYVEGLSDSSGLFNLPLAGVVVNENLISIPAQPVIAYYDAGDEPSILVGGLAGPIGEGRLTIVGYLQNCTVSNCATIQR
jgi:hypothetical protein